MQQKSEPTVQITPLTQKSSMMSDSESEESLMMSPLRGFVTLLSDRLVHSGDPNLISNVLFATSDRIVAQESVSALI